MLNGAPGPYRAELARETLACGIPRAREGEHPPALGAGHLGEQMRRGAEAVQAEIAPLARGAVGAIADEPGAQERRQLRGRPPGGQGQTVARVGERLLGVTPVPGITGKARPLAQILLPREIGRASCRERV